MSLFEYLKKYICSNCHIGIMKPHDEDKYNRLYIKCPFCGFTKKIEKDGK